MKGKGEVVETMLYEKEASRLSENEFKELIIRKLNKLTQNYQKLQRNNNELTANYINMQKEIEIINKGQEEMKYAISELKSTVEGIKSRLHEADDRISKLEDRVEKNTQNEQEREKRLRKNEEGLKEIQDNMKCNNINIIRIPEGQEEEKGILLGTALPGFRGCNPSWLRLSQNWDHKPLRRQSLSPWQVCHLCPLHPVWP